MVACASLSPLAQTINKEENPGGNGSHNLHTFTSSISWAAGKVRLKPHKAPDCYTQSGGAAARTQLQVQTKKFHRQTDEQMGGLKYVPS